MTVPADDDRPAAIEAAGLVTVRRAYVLVLGLVITAALAAAVILALSGDEIAAVAISAIGSAATGALATLARR